MLRREFTFITTLILLLEGSILKLSSLLCRNGNCLLTSGNKKISLSLGHCKKNKCLMLKQGTQESVLLFYYQMKPYKAILSSHHFQNGSWKLVLRAPAKSFLAKGSFTRPTSEADFTLSQCLLQNRIIFIFKKMCQPNAKSDSCVNRP